MNTQEQHEQENSKESTGNDNRLTDQAVDKVVTPTETQQKKPKPIKLEEKPFKIFIEEHLIPDLRKSIENTGTKVLNLELRSGPRPVVGGNCHFIYGKIGPGRKFWVAFNEENIASKKTIALAEIGSEPDLLESFLIDEKKSSKALLISRILQRLNGQKWLGAN
tara:strand:+ start:1459 stop:1950 length:492 start_codon:yes stop_codon:yes gene_type:complete